MLVPAQFYTVTRTINLWPKSWWIKSSSTTPIPTPDTLQPTASPVYLLAAESLGLGEAIEVIVVDVNGFTHVGYNNASLVLECFKCI